MILTSFLFSFLFLTYTAICWLERPSAKVFFSLVFVFIAIFIRILVPPELSKDFIAYDLLNIDVSNISLTNFTVEPLRLVIQWAALTVETDGMSSTSILYYLGLITACFFFIFLAWLDDLRILDKMFIFSFLFPVLGYVWISAVFTYSLFSFGMYFFYENNNKSKFRRHIFLLIFSINHVANLFIYIIHFIAVNFKLSQLWLLFTMLIFVIINDSILLYIEHGIRMIDAYSAKDKNLSFLHFFIFILLFYMAIIMVRRSLAIRKDIFFWALLFIYILALFISPVVAFRFFIFLVLYLAVVYRYLLGFRDNVINFIFVLPIFMVIFFIRFYQVVNLDGI
jgi:hypothetical protein